jgi:2-iminobutanoate/2-iminopropanoate deaminase
VSGAETTTGTGRLRRISAAPGGLGPVGPFSQAVVANGFVFTSGQIPAAPPVDLPFADQVRATLANLAEVLQAAGSDLDHVVKINTYLTEPGQLASYNEIYSEFFGPAHWPARTTVAVDLWGVSLEIECVAVLSGTVLSQGSDA